MVAFYFNWNDIIEKEFGKDAQVKRINLLINGKSPIKSYKQISYITSPGRYMQFFTITKRQVKETIKNQTWSKVYGLTVKDVPNLGRGIFAE